VVLVDTSVWIDVFRDADGSRGATLRELLDGEEVVLSRFHQLELLQGCRDEKEWSLLKSYLDAQDYLELDPASWEAAARIYFELRRTGHTVRSPIDCCIAQLALDYDLMLLHRDGDFRVIAEARPLRQVWVEW
jgi:predicted nucleic acid-binding protein